MKKNKKKIKPINFINSFRNKKNFILINILVVVDILNFFITNNITYDTKSNPFIRIIKLVLIDIFITSTNNILFLWMLLIIFLIEIIKFPVSLIYIVLNNICKSFILSSFILLPVVFFNNLDNVLFIIRIITVVANLSIFLSTTNWQQFIIGLNQLRVPYTIILVIDISIKYIYLLGIYLRDILISIKLRSFGKKLDSRVIGSILGLLYLISLEKINELHQAMIIRNVVNVYHHSRQIILNKYDYLIILEIFIVSVLYIFI